VVVVVVVAGAGVPADVVVVVVVGAGVPADVVFPDPPQLMLFASIKLPYPVNIADVQSS
jgi:hypothetical protein